jgi:hypothetical protein
MRVKGATVKEFKRFHDLTIEGIPESARVVVLAGPSGQGKSSLFDAFIMWQRTRYLGWREIPAYYDRNASAMPPPPTPQRTSVDFYDGDIAGNRDRVKKAFYFRTAYRNEPEIGGGLAGLARPDMDQPRFQRMIEADVSVSRNYQWLVSGAFDDVFEHVSPETPVGEWRNSIIGDLQAAMQRLFPNLILNGLGSPFRDPTFRFTKGAASGYRYENLSGGEKAAFDLLLDMIVRRQDYDDTVFCIDEPEAHVSPRLHAQLLDEIFSLVPKAGQLWLATHAIGMLRHAKEIGDRDPGTVVFLDFGDQDFDRLVTLRPVVPNRAFWDSALQIALADFAQLVAPRILVVCEGNPAASVPGKNADHDALCYNTIFGDTKPDAKFVSAGSSSEVARDRLGVAKTLPAIVSGTSIIQLIDRDDHSANDIAEFQRKGISVLSRRHIESYLWADEILIALCEEKGAKEEVPNVLADKEKALSDSRKRGNQADDIKSAAGPIFTAISPSYSSSGSRSMRSA